jgi:hypothetical protein
MIVTMPMVVEMVTVGNIFYHLHVKVKGEIIPAMKTYGGVDV